jgi:IMP dehydrogenase/GMP reductase
MTTKIKSKIIIKVILKNNMNGIREQQKQYRNVNKDKIKQYRNDNKDKIREQQQELKELEKELNKIMNK